MSDTTWSPEQIGDQSGRTALVTGPSVGGLGYFTALELARHGTRVVLAGRSAEKLAATETAIRAEVPEAQLDRLSIDLASLDSVRAAAETAAAYGPLDLLINNAGVMAPGYQRTDDGFELQLATNHLGPFLLTGLLLPQLVSAGPSRVVTVSSQMHRMARRAPLDDPQERRQRYLRWPEYAESKLANLLFTFELERRLRAADLPVSALAAHPGYAGTHLLANGQVGRSSGGVASILDAVNRAVSQPADRGAWPTLMAATADLPGGTYCGPGGLGQMSGTPRVVGTTSLAKNVDAQRELWELSERAVGLSYP